MGFPRVADSSRSDLIAATSRRTVTFAAEGLRALAERFADPSFRASFEQLVDLIASAHGRVIVAGMGKSGLIARKLASTLTSTGTPAVFLHPAEAGHGDLGLITRDDVVLIVTRSGETAELGAVLDYCKRFAVPLAVVTSRQGSSISRAATLCLRLPAVREACRNDLTPTTSTTLQAVFGDALAMALMELRGFSADDFHAFHPRGRLGAKLLRVRDLMVRRGDVPVLGQDAPLQDATVEMTRARMGGTAVVDADGRLVGVFTDGDLRRVIASRFSMTEPIATYMNAQPVTVAPDALASEALGRMHEAKVLLLLVCEGDRLVGAVHMHDMLQAGVA